MLLTIDSIQENSGKGSAVFSKKAQQINTLFSSFNKPLPAKKEKPGTPDFNYDEWVKDFKEIKYK
jgi:hypothetical protein